MANSKSAEKRARVAKKRHIFNRTKKSELSTKIKKFRKLIDENKKEEAEQLLSEIFSKLDKAKKTNRLHRKNVDRKKRKLSKLLSSLEG